MTSTTSAELTCAGCGQSIGPQAIWLDNGYYHGSCVPLRAEAVQLKGALRALLAAIADEESNRDGEYLLPPDPGCIRCTRGVADSGKLCARHAAERVLEKP